METTMEPNEAMKTEVRCEACGCAFVPELMVERKRKLEFTFFRCDFCGKGYLVSVTDQALRRDIARYAQMAARGKQLTEKQRREARDLLCSNINRSHELMENYTGRKTSNG